MLSPWLVTENYESRRLLKSLGWNPIDVVPGALPNAVDFMTIIRVPSLPPPRDSDWPTPLAALIEDALFIMGRYYILKLFLRLGD